MTTITTLLVAQLQPNTIVMQHALQTTRADRQADRQRYAECKIRRAAGYSRIRPNKHITTNGMEPQICTIYIQRLHMQR